MLTIIIFSVFKFGSKTQMKWNRQHMKKGSMILLHVMLSLKEHFLQCLFLPHLCLSLSLSLSLTVSLTLSLSLSLTVSLSSPISVSPWLSLSLCLCPCLYRWLCPCLFISVGFSLCLSVSLLPSLPPPLTIFL